MKSISIKDTVYHGTITPFDYLDLRYGRGYKDFGKGIYFAYLKKQSISLAKSRLRNTKGIKKVVLYTYQIDKSVIPYLNIKIFDKADLEWLDFILTCRRCKYTPHKYDVVIGYTADDNTNLCINNYFEGVYGQIGSLEAKRTLLNNLEVENLGIQLFIGTQKGLSLINQNSRKVEFIC